jgi:hypothetical protein
MNAPARKANANIVIAFMFAFLTPTCSALSAISGGSSESIEEEFGVSWFMVVIASLVQRRKINTGQ